MYDTFFEIFLSGNYSLRAGWAKAQDEFDCQDLCRVVHLSWSWLSWMYSKISRRRWFFFGKTENSHGGLRLENVFQDEWWMNAGVKHSLCKYDIITFINFISQSYMPFCVKLCVWNGELHILKPRAQPAGCTRMFCEYAKEFLAAMQKVGGEMDHEDGELEGWRMPWELWNFPDETLWTFCGFAGTGGVGCKVLQTESYLSTPIPWSSESGPANDMSKSKTGHRCWKVDDSTASDLSFHTL